ncbi:ribonuclease H-like isoform X2 [Lycorma delicatula]|uniref:ribonuclease H-like isoform X2 n=1 Tax=Lycorma delicatula TaxID=130591 RepID=UPI003F51486F
MVDVIQSTLYTFLCLFITLQKSFQEQDDAHTEVTEAPFIMENGLINVYVDGCCVNNGRKNARAGVGVWFNFNHPYNTFKPVEGRPTNINAEIEAAIAGIETALQHGINKIMVHTESAFVIKCITNWIKNWKENGWKTLYGDEVKNQNTIKKLDNIVNRMQNVYWVHVRRHGSEIGNIKAGALAQKGAKLYALQNNIPEYDTDVIYHNNNYIGNKYSFNDYNRHKYDYASNAGVRYKSYNNDSNTYTAGDRYNYDRRGGNNNDDDDDDKLKTAFSDAS